MTTIKYKSPTSLTPCQIVSELDRYIIGQNDAKRAVAIALRNRWRRHKLDDTLRDEVMPKNILMIGPTGVGKTEISRRLAKLTNAPFIKIEATKFTEVGYVGRDVEQIIRDLVKYSITMVQADKREYVKKKAYKLAEERILDTLVGKDASSVTRNSFRKKLHNGSIDDKEIDIKVSESNASTMTTMDIPGIPGSQMGMVNLGDMLGKAFGEKTKIKKLSIKNSYEILIIEESNKLLDDEQIIKEAIYRVENDGIVFLDEIDKICIKNEQKSGDVSREGVQRDLLPLIEGTVVSTKYGSISTDHILFIASGAFHIAKPSDLLPELQGRLPIRVELQALTKDDFIRILTEPEASLIKQYKALIKTENVTLDFTKDAIHALASIAVNVNENVQNIGARRLQTVMERVLDEISFNATDKNGETLIIDSKYVNNNIGDLARNINLSKFIL